MPNCRGGGGQKKNPTNRVWVRIVFHKKYTSHINGNKCKWKLFKRALKWYIQDVLIYYPQKRLKAAKRPVAAAKRLAQPFLGHLGETRLPPYFINLVIQARVLWAKLWDHVRWLDTGPGYLYSKAQNLCHSTLAGAVSPFCENRKIYITLVLNKLLIK